MGKLEDLNTFADIGATIADNFDLEKPVIVESKLDMLIYLNCKQSDALE